MASGMMAESPPRALRKIPDDQPWRWLQAGWQDLMRAPQVSLTYGGVVTGASWLLALVLWEADWLYLLLPLAGGFLLVAPFMAVGLYETSRRLERHDTVSLRTALLTWRRSVQIAGFGIILLLLHFAWMRTAMLWFVLYFHDGTPPLDQIPFYLLDARNLPFLVVGTALGAGFALFTFAISAISLPLLVDRDIDVVSAILLSLRAVLANPKAMLLWAGLILLFTAVGLATFFFGLALLFPLVAHASWHAYRDMVD